MSEIIKFWNDNFNKGVTVFQMSLMAMMVLGAFLENDFLIIFSMINCLFGYLEPNQNRFSLGDGNDSQDKSEASRSIR